MLGCLKLGDFGQVRLARTIVYPSLISHLSLLPLQARSDYGKHRLFFRKSGTQRRYATKTQLGFGAGVATSPEVRDATSNGPDEEAEEDQPLWELMRGNDTWAVGRMMFVLLLQCIHGEAKAGVAGRRLPPLLAGAKYKQEDLPPLPGYSAALRALLAGMMEHDPAKRLTPE